MAINKDTMSHYFHLPIDEAAKRLNVGLSVFKQQCRDIGIQRWPYRKIKSLQTMIADFQVTNQLLLTFNAEFILLASNHTAYFKSYGLQHRLPILLIQNIFEHRNGYLFHLVILTTDAASLSLTRGQSTKGNQSNDSILKVMNSI